ncbi:MAG: serine hydrolase [Oscillospiraceae bacterium]
MSKKEKYKISTLNIAVMSLCLISIFFFVFANIILDNRKSIDVYSQSSQAESSNLDQQNPPTVSDTPTVSDRNIPKKENLVAQIPPKRNEFKPQPPYAPHFSKSDIEKINQVVKSYDEPKNSISVYYEDLYSKNVYSYNTQQKYFIASIIKAPYCMYLYQLASEAKLDLNEKLLLEPKHIKPGTGKLKEIDAETLPKEFSIKELISYSILHSDNSAMDLLLDFYPHSGYQKYANSIGITNPKDVKYVVNGDICATDAAIYAKALYHFIETNPYGLELKKDMLETINPMIVSKNPVARKYGWGEKSFHDMAIVYAKNPYVLVILSDHEAGTQKDYQMFSEITRILEKTQPKL